MKFSTRLLVLGAALQLFAGNAGAQQHGPPGRFDYYLLSLSWSPQFCAEGGERSAPGQCAPQRHLGFVLHGLWPQFAKGGWPAFCTPGGPVPAEIQDRMLTILPNRSLIEHEWEKHGTCSGLDASLYFAASAAAFRSIRIPEPYRQPDGYLATNAGQLAADFAAANPGLEPSGIAVVCKKQYLAEVRLCLSKELKPAACGPDVRNQCSQTVVLRPAR